MAPIAVGDVIPDGTLAYFDDQDQLQSVSIQSLAAGKKVVLFAVPGAFTPTCRWSTLRRSTILCLLLLIRDCERECVCSMKHVPGFIEKADELKSKGVEEILCVSGMSSS